MLLLAKFALVRGRPPAYKRPTALTGFPHLPIHSRLSQPSPNFSQAYSMEFVWLLPTMPLPPDTNSPEDAETISKSPPGKESHSPTESPSVTSDQEVSASAGDVFTAGLCPSDAVMRRELDPYSRQPIDPLPTDAKSGLEDNQDDADSDRKTARSSDYTDKNQRSLVEDVQTPYPGGAGGDPDARWTSESISVAPYAGGRVGVIGQTAASSGTQNNSCTNGDGKLRLYSRKTVKFLANRARRLSGKTGSADQSSDQRTAGVSSHMRFPNSGDRITGSTRDT